MSEQNNNQNNQNQDPFKKENNANAGNEASNRNGNFNNNSNSNANNQNAGNNIDHNAKNDTNNANNASNDGELKSRRISKEDKEWNKLFKTYHGCCEKHGEYETSFVNRCPTCWNEEAERERHEKERAAKAYRASPDSLHEIGVPARYYQASLSQLKALSAEQAAAYDILRKIDLQECRANGRNLLLLGSTGTGKTHALNAFIRKAHIDLKLSARLIEYRVFLRDVCQRYEEDKQMIQRVQYCDLLAIDEIVTIKLSERQTYIFQEIINYRYNARLPTFIATNLSISELTQQIGDRIVSRLDEKGTLLMMKHPDMRCFQ